VLLGIIKRFVPLRLNLVPCRRRQ